MSISPATDIVLDVARAADPARVAIYGANTGKGTIQVNDGGPLSLKLLAH